MLEASRQLGWRRNLLVNGMQTGRTQTIGVMIPPFDSFWVSVLSGIHDALAECDYLPITVWIGNLGDMPHFEKERRRRTRSKSTGCSIVVSTGSSCGRRSAWRITITFRSLSNGACRWR